jgi:hypothetical protein
LKYGLKKRIKTGDNQLIGASFDNKQFNADYEGICDLYEGMERHRYFGPLMYRMLHEAFCIGWYVYDLWGVMNANPIRRHEIEPDTPLPALPSLPVFHNVSQHHLAFSQMAINFSANAAGDVPAIAEPPPDVATALQSVALGQLEMDDSESE